MNANFIYICVFVAPFSENLLRVSNQFASIFQIAILITAPTAENSPIHDFNLLSWLLVESEYLPLILQ